MNPSDRRAEDGGEALRLSGVSRKYSLALGLRHKEVLHAVDLAVPAGESLGLVGPNGSGKSTLLRLLAGIDRASAGEIAVLGGSPQSGDVKQRVGFLPEDSPFPRELRAISVLEMLGTLHRMKRRDAHERGLALLERVGLGAHAKSSLGRFSRGMLRRFGLAQAVLHEPELLLLDEPTAGLDAEGFGVLEMLLDEARARGASIVVSSHLLTDVHARCEKIAVLIEGRVAAHGPAAELLGSAGARVEVEVEGLSSADLAALERDVRARGGRWIGARPAQSNLLELYRRFTRRGSS